MAFCATCGAAVEGSFCAKCGSQVGAAPSASSGTAMQVSGAMADNVASALCYLVGLITGIIFLVLAPYNKNPVIRFHAFQSITAPMPFGKVRGVFSTRPPPVICASPLSFPARISGSKLLT